MLDQPNREVLLRVASNSLAKIGFVRWGRDVTGALPSGTETSRPGAEGLSGEGGCGRWNYNDGESEKIAERRL